MNVTYCDFCVEECRGVSQFKVQQMDASRSTVDLCGDCFRNTNPAEILAKLAGHDVVLMDELRREREKRNADSRGEHIYHWDEFEQAVR